MNLIAQLSEEMDSKPKEFPNAFRAILIGEAMKLIKKHKQLDESHRLELTKNFLNRLRNKDLINDEKLSQLSGCLSRA